MSENRLKPSNNLKQDHRNSSLDTITGFMITWMLFYHIMQWAGLTNTPIYKHALQWLFFFMPWFYFKAGMFHHKRMKQSFLVDFKKNIHTSIRPLVIYALIGFLFWAPEQIISFKSTAFKIIQTQIHSFVKSGDIASNLPLWFFLSFFFTKVTCYFLLKRGSTILWIAVFIGAGAAISQYEIISFFGFHTIPLGVAFYCSGHLFNERSLPPKKISSSILLIIPFIAMNYFFPSYIDFHFNKLLYGNYLSYIVLSLLAIISLLGAFNFISIPAVEWVGKRSLLIFALHWPLFTACRLICYLSGFQIVGWEFALVLGVSAGITLLVSHFLALCLSKKIIVPNPTA